MKKLISKTIDRFYFPFLQRTIPRELFRYGACGTAVVVLDWVLFWFCTHFVFEERTWDAGFLLFSAAYTLSKLASAPAAALAGFWLQKNITFRASPLRGTTQFFRYLVVFIVNLSINILLGNGFMERFDLWATPANMTVTILTIIFSFLMQKYFTFRKRR
jgi:putative flippase GtrA